MSATATAPKLRPLAGWVLIARDDAKRKTDGGVHLPDTMEEKPSTGTVVRVGKDVHELREGDRVVVSQYLGTEYTDDDGTPYIVAKEDHISVAIDR